MYLFHKLTKSIYKLFRIIRRLFYIERSLCFHKALQIFDLVLFSFLFSLSYILFSPAYMEVPFFVCFTVHKHRKQIVVNAEFLIYLVKVLVLPFHKQIELFFRHYHLHQIRLDTACIGDEIDILPVD